MRAIITGITGQDGSYLSEYLLSLGYEVHGMVRRNSVSENQTFRINHIIDHPDLFLYYSDLTDPISVHNIIANVLPDEVYHLGAQSHVGQSFDIPLFTAEVNAMGTLSILESIRSVKPDARIYHAATSEMFGNNADVDGYQRETTPMNPVSPYACSKLYAHNICSNYRRAYNMFIVSGILFNHETLISSMPLIYRIDDGPIDIAPISDICKMAGFHVDRSLNEYQSSLIRCNLQVWDKNGWTDVNFASAYPVGDHTKFPISINARNAIYTATTDHVVIMSDNSEKKIQNISVRDRVLLCDYPVIQTETETEINENEAKLLGLLVGNGYFLHNLKFMSVNSEVNDKVKALWAKVGDGKWSYNKIVSEFTGKKIEYIVLIGSGLDWFYQFDMYTMDRDIFGRKYKKVPKQILSAGIDTQRSFLEGYNLADGLKINNFKTNSPSLASGLLFLISRVTGQLYNLTLEQLDEWGKIQTYYSINLLSNSKCRQNARNVDVPKITQHWQNNEVKKVIMEKNFQGWFYDLETKSGTFHCGVGQGIVHNSPRRGVNFVTNKVVKTAVEIKKGLSNKLELGNLEARRDWGHAMDYVRAMQMMLQVSEARDYVVATGISRSVQNLVDLVFCRLGLDPSNYVKVTDRYKRPEELWYLCGDSSNIRTELGWKPIYDFESMIDDMIKHWMDFYKG